MEQSTKHHISIEIPEHAYELKIGTDLQSRGLLFKTNTDNGLWKGHFISFPPGECGKPAPYFTKMIRDKSQVNLYV